MKMAILVGIILFLLICCFIEALILVKDGGIVAELIQSAKTMAVSAGWKSVFKPAVSMIFGKLRDLYKKESGSNFHDEKIHIAFFPSGGLGDYIISAVVLEEIQEICTKDLLLEENTTERKSVLCCEITVYCDKMQYGKIIYGNRKGILLKDYDQFEKDRNSYDLALHVEHFIHVCNVDQKRLETYAPKLRQKICYITEHWNELYVPVREQCFRERVLFERCRLLGLDRYTELRMGEAFEIKEKKIFVPMDMEWKSVWKQSGYKSGSYITVNYGADAMRIGQEQLKVWPKSYFEQLIEMLQTAYPTMKFIQIGGKNAERIKGCDEYVLGESLELTKWILKDSLLHVDCEGGLVHLAWQLGTKSAVIFGPTPLFMYAYKENINLQSMKCNNCMGLHADWAYSCYQGSEFPMCMYDITPEQVYKAIKDELEMTGQNLTEVRVDG